MAHPTSRRSSLDRLPGTRDELCSDKHARHTVHGCAPGRAYPPRWTPRGRRDAELGDGRCPLGICAALRVRCRRARGVAHDHEARPPPAVDDDGRGCTSSDLRMRARGSARGLPGGARLVHRVCCPVRLGRLRARPPGRELRRGKLVRAFVYVVVPALPRVPDRVPYVQDVLRRVYRL